jgi:hypothetical protein
MSAINSLQKTIQADAAEALPKTTRYLFAPVDKRAFGVAIGLTAALALALTTAVDLLLPDPWLGLNLLQNYFAIHHCNSALRQNHPAMCHFDFSLWQNHFVLWHCNSALR